MVFNFRTVDLTEDPVDFAAPASPTSRSTASCDCTCTRTIVTGARASAFHLLAFPAINNRRAKPSNPLDIADAVSKSDLRSFTLKELQVATCNFSDKFIVGRGGFGKVYKALLPDGSFVAIKRLISSSGQGLKQFQAEVEISNRVGHRNLVPAIGFCVSRNPVENILVYPFKVNGDFSSRLRKAKSQLPLDWPTRKRILLGAARGLCYLHNNGIIHGDIKASNILLDESLEACIGDFGTAKVLDRKEQQVSSSEVQNHVFLRFATDSSPQEYTTFRDVSGTKGHMAPEYLLHGNCSLKNDVYSFGVTIFEVVTGQRVVDIERMGNRENLTLFDWIRSCLKEKNMDKLLDPDLLGNCREDDVKKTIQLGLACTLLFPEKRPSMLQAVRVLEGTELKLKDIGIDTDYIMMMTAREQPFTGYYESCSWVITCTHLASEELSGPR